MPQSTQIDHVDQILSQWAAARPDLDAAPMGVVGRICRLASLLTKEQVRVFNEYGLDFAGFDVLATLRRSDSPNEMTPTQLARSMLVTAGAVTQRLARLEADGLITRTHSTTDRRVISVALTAQGRQLIDDALPSHLANETNMLAPLQPDELLQLTCLLRRMLLAQDDNPL